MKHKDVKKPFKNRLYLRLVVQVLHTQPQVKLYKSIQNRQLPSTKENVEVLYTIEIGWIKRVDVE